MRADTRTLFNEINSSSIFIDNELQTAGHVLYTVAPNNCSFCDWQKTRFQAMNIVVDSRDIQTSIPHPCRRQLVSVSTYFYMSCKFTGDNGSPEEYIRGFQDERPSDSNLHMVFRGMEKYQHEANSPYISRAVVRYASLETEIILDIIVTKGLLYVSRRLTDCN